MPWFFNVAAKHTVTLFSCVIMKKDLERAWGRIFVPGLNVNSPDMRNIWTVTFRTLMDGLYFGRKATRLAGLGPIQFTFDERSEKARIMAEWDGYLQGLPEASQFFGGAPKFMSDKDALPLQAADLWAWWARTMKETGATERPKFAKAPPWIDIEYGEEALLLLLADSIRAATYSDATYILDLKTGRPIPIGPGRVVVTTKSE